MEIFANNFQKMIAFHGGGYSIITMNRIGEKIDKEEQTMSDAQKTERFLSDEQYVRNPEGRPLPPERLAALNVGAINSEQTGYFCDSLTTGCEVDVLKENLADYYGITDRDSAAETLDWLRDRGHRFLFDAFKAIYRGEGIDCAAMTQDEMESSQEYFMNLQYALAMLAEYGYFSDVTELPQISVLAWDLGRMVMVTRCCFDCGYLSEGEAWAYIDGALAACREAYDDWEALARGYVFGRAMWSGPNITLEGIMQIAYGLLHDGESPWQLVSLQKEEKSAGSKH